MAITTDPNTPFPLNDFTEEGGLSKSRLDDAATAQQIFYNMHDANLNRNNYGAYLQRVCDGAPPFSQSALRASAQAWRANFSTKESKARKDAAKTPFYDLFSSGQTYAYVTTLEDGELDADTASGVITEKFDDMMRDDIDIGADWFDMEMWTMLDSFVGFGRGWLFRPVPDSWEFESIPWFKVRFPDGTGVKSKDWSMFTIEHIFDPVTLNGYVKDEKNASAAGWNIKQVREALKTATPIDPNSMQDAMVIAQMIKDQDIQLMYRTATVQAASVFVKEWDGTWSRMIVQVNVGNQNSPTLGKDEWLYYKRNVGKDINQIISPFILEVETGSVNGLTGILDQITDVVKVKNRMRCAQVDNVFLRSTVLMQAGNAASRVKSGLITVGGGVTLVPEGMQIQQSSMIGDVQSTLVVSESMDRELDINTGIFRPQMEKPSGNPEPLGTTQLRYAQASVLSSSTVNRFLAQLDSFYKENYRRATLGLPENSSNPFIKAAKKFQKACKDRGVSDKQLKKVKCVKAVRVIGNGSPAMRAQITAEMGPIVPQLGQRGQINWRKDFIAARGGQASVDRYMPITDQMDVPTWQDREAMEENGMVKGGNPVIVIENDDHAVHLRRHFDAVAAGFQSLQQGANPEEVAAFVQGMMPHIAEHIQLLPERGEQKAAEKLFREIQGAYEKLIAMIQAQQPDPEQNQQMMSDIQLKQMKAQNDIEVKNLKTQAGIEDKAKKTKFALSIQGLKARQDMGIADAKAANEIERQTALTTTKINNATSTEA